MTNGNIVNPINAVNKICGSSKVIAIAILMCISVAIPVISAFSTVSALDFLYASEVLGSIMAVLMVIALFCLVPTVLLINGLFMAYTGVNRDQRRMIIGLHLIKVSLWIIAFFDFIYMMCIVIPIILFESSGTVFNSPLIVLMLLFMALFAVRILYFCGLANMVASVADTIRFKTNLTVRLGYVAVIGWIGFAFGIISVLSGLNGIFRNLNFYNVCDTVAQIIFCVVIVLINLCFSQYDSLCGAWKFKERKKMFVSVVSNRQHTGEMEEMGVRVDEYGKLRITSFGKHTFGTYVVGSKPGRNTTYGFAQSSQTSFYNSSRPSTSYQSPSKPSYTQQSYTPAPRTYNSGPSTYTPSPLTYARAPEPKPEPAPTSVFAPTSVVKEEPKREYGAPRVAELKGSPLKLFGSDMEELAENYEIIGKKQYKEELTAPITPTAAVVVFDSFSENKLLRMAWKNKSGYGVTSVSLDLTFRDSCGRLIAKMNNADFKPRGEILPGEIAFAELGLPIPDATCGGKVTVTRVEFSNGLFWSKTVDGVEFEALESKRAYELKNSTFDKVLVSCIELQGLKLDAANHTLEFAVKNIGDAALVSYELLVKASSGSYEENVSRVARNDIRVMPGETGEMHKLTLPSQAIGGTVEVLSGVYENNAMETNLAKFRFGSR